MCGIVGYIGKTLATDAIVSGLKKLEYRGYDSAGVAVLDPLHPEIKLYRSIGKIVELEKVLAADPPSASCTVGIGHTRWATHGAPTVANAHPHLSMDGTIAVVHNGIIENYVSLRTRLESKGFVFKSQTDTEVLAHLIQECKSDNLTDSVMQALSFVEGTYGIAVISSDFPNVVVTARKGWGRFTLRAKGRSAHAGGNLADGRSAIVEIARHVLEIEALTKTERHATFNVGVIAGGTRTNVVPADAYIDVDMRVDDIDTAERLTAQMLTRKAHDPDVELTVEGGMNRPPFERSTDVARLYAATEALARRLQQPMAEMSRGGVSDGNLVAATGVPVLDGMGCNGGGAHALDEHILASTVAPRHALMHAMMMSEDFQTLALDRHR